MLKKTVVTLFSFLALAFTCSTLEANPPSKMGPAGTQPSLAPTKPAGSVGCLEVSQSGDCNRWKWSGDHWDKGGSYHRLADASRH